LTSAVKSAPARALGHLLGARLQHLDLRVAGILGYHHQHLRQVDLHAAAVGAALLFVKELIDFEVAHVNPGVDLALTQFGQQDLVAQLVMQLLEPDALLRQLAAQRGHIDLVLPRHVLFRLVDAGLVHLQAQLARLLQLRLFTDQALEHLAHQHVVGRHGPALAGQLRLKALQACLHFIVGDGLGVDHRHDVVGLARRAGRRRCSGRAAGRGGPGAQLGRWPQTLGRGGLGHPGQQGNQGEGKGTSDHGGGFQVVGIMHQL
jgi:hypothetical protein